MKHIAISLALFMGMQLSCFAQQGFPVSIVISTPTQATPTGTTIRLNVSIKNTGDHPVKIIKALGDDGQADAANIVEVRDPEGVKLEPLVQHRWLSRKRVVVEQGQSVEDYLNLSELFNMSKPGRYMVSLRHELLQPDAERAEDRKLFVPSNKLEIVVLP